MNVCVLKSFKVLKVILTKNYEIVRIISTIKFNATLFTLIMNDAYSIIPDCNEYSNYYKIGNFKEIYFIIVCINLFIVIPLS